MKGDEGLVKNASLQEGTSFAGRPAMEQIHPALVTSEVPVFFATTDGQTRRIAHRLSMMLRERGFDSQAIDMASSDADFIDWTRVRALIIGASVRGQHHQRAAESFVKSYTADLIRRPSAFFSVSLAAASHDAAKRDTAQKLAAEFPRRLGWHPDMVLCFAGRLAYTRYRTLMRFVMKHIARRARFPTDTNRDYEFTNWEDVARLASDMEQMITGRLAATTFVA
jgi:menaquinone-dependent protoporphyrinogen oxidase